MRYIYLFLCLILISSIFKKEKEDYHSYINFINQPDKVVVFRLRATDWKGNCRIDRNKIVTGNNIEIGEEMECSNEYAQQFSDDYFGRNIDGLNEIHADGTILNGYSIRGDVVLNRSGKPVAASTVYLGTGRGSNVLLFTKLPHI